MYKLCKSEESAKRQRQMEQGLLDMMQTVRYEDITVSDLCQKMNIPRKSFYRYFSGKEGALHGLIDHTMMEYEAFSHKHQKGRKRNLQMELETFFEFWVEHGPFLDALHRSGLSGAMIERAVNYSVSEGVFPIRFLPNENMDVRRHVVMFAVCGMLTMMVRWHQSDYRESVSEMASITKRLLNQPLFPVAEELMF